jgi:adenylate cyclase
VQAVAVFALSLLGAFLGLRAPSVRIVWTVGLAISALLLASAWAALSRSWSLPVLPPLGGFVAATGLAVAHVLREERREKAMLRELFSRHVSKRVLDELWRKREQFMAEGRLRTQRMEISVLMADLQGYTEVSEKMEPGALLEWVNEFMSVMAHLVETGGGMVDDYWGDGLKANFTLPLPRTQAHEVQADARNAVACALGMAREMERLNARWRARGLPTGRLRVGIHTGVVVAGYVGSTERLKYTSVGDTVNVAARLESTDREGFLAEAGTSARILVSVETRRHLGADVEVEPLGPRFVAGRSQPVEVFRVRGGPKEA